MKKIQLIEGSFSSADALEILTRMIEIKIRHHENKIHPEGTEEDIKYREAKIKKLQRDLQEMRQYIQEKNGNIVIDSMITIE